MDVGASLKIDSNLEAEEIMANVFLTITEYFSPGIKRSSFDTEYEKANDLSVLFDGPLLKDGFISSSSLQAPRKQINTRELIRLILQIDGVNNISHLHFFQDGEEADNFISFQAFDESPGFKIPASKNDLKIKLTKAGRSINIDLQETYRIFKKKLTFSNVRLNTQKDIQHKLKIEPGTYREFSEHYSIQHDFPAIYGIGEYGVPNSEDPIRIAQAKQLKAYLAIFDQIMFDYQNQIQNIKSFYSADHLQPSDYLSSVFRDFPSSGQIIRQVENDSTENGPTHYEQKKFFARKNELLDYMIGLYGDKLDLSPLNDFNYYNTDFDGNALLVKSTFLQNIINLNKNKGLAFNYLKPVFETQNSHGMRMKSLLELGISNMSERSLSDAFTNLGLKLLSDPDFKEYRAGAEDIDFAWINEVAEDMGDVESETLDEVSDIDLLSDLKKSFYLLQKNVIYNSLLRFGVNLKFYKIGRLSTTNFYTALFKAPDEANWQNLGMFKTRQEAVVAVNKLQKLIVSLNMRSEGVHLLEKVLLQNKSTEDKCKVTITAPSKNLKFTCTELLTFDQLDDLTRRLYPVLLERKGLTFQKVDNLKGLKIGINFMEITFLSEEEFDSIVLVYRQIEAFYDEVANLTHEEFCESCLSYKTIYNVEFDRSELANRIALFLPAWTSRFNSPKFRLFAEGVFRNNCPAHIYPEFYWLDFRQMQDFESVYSKWLNAMHMEEEPNIGTLSLKLLNLIDSF